MTTLFTARETSDSSVLLRAAVIGTGKISEEHLRFLGADHRVKLVGVCDLSPALARYAASKFGAEKTFVDYREMFDSAAPDVVHVLTPPHTHVRIIGDALERGIHVIAEKPLAPTLDEFEFLWEKAQSAGVRLIEDHNYRFNRSVQTIEEQVKKGELGEIREVEIRFCLGIRNKGGRYADENIPHPSHGLPAGVLHEFLPHMVYLLLQFIPTWDSVRAKWSNHGGGSLFSADDLDALVVSGAAHGRLRFSCSQAPDCFCIMVRGTQGWMETDLFQPHVVKAVPRAFGPQLSPLVNQGIRGLTLAMASVKGLMNKVLQVTPYEGLATFLDRHYTALRTGEPAPVNYEDMRKTAKLIEDLVHERENSEVQSA